MMSSTPSPLDFPRGAKRPLSPMMKTLRPFLPFLFVLPVVACGLFSEEATEEASTEAEEIQLGEGVATVEVEEVEDTSKYALSVPDKAEETPAPTPAPAASSSSSPKKRDEGLGNEDLPGLNADQIRTPIKRNMAQVRACYERALKTNDGLKGKIAVSFTIGADGKVRSPRASSNSTGNSSLAKCVVGRVRSWRFPTAAGPTDVVYPFNFEPRDF